MTTQQQRPTATGKRGQLAKGICGDELTQQNIDLAILACRRKAQLAIYICTEWAIFARACARHPRIVSISVFFLLLSPSALFSASKPTPCRNRLCWPQSLLHTCPEFSPLDLHLTLGPACFAADLCDPLGHHPHGSSLGFLSFTFFKSGIALPGNLYSYIIIKPTSSVAPPTTPQHLKLDFVSPASQTTTPQRTDLPILVFCILLFLFAMHGFFWRY